ncbi:hypothetical protein K3495_g133 [Podosphaera aphanis]|nr:hypothetical protein K3495_g133 [Podosphaera aphanis]
MPRAAVGTTKYLNNKLKSKGLQRLRWYCQVCERQMRDENGFKMHTQSESHVRQMLIVGEDPKRFINDYSNQFQRDFLQLLRTSHGEKKVHMNHFYQEYIHNKEHIHMNATKWPSLTEYAKHLGREGLCRVEENEKGLHISWIDNSPENLRRQDAIRKKERQDRGDEEREKMLILEQVKRAQKDAGEREEELDETERTLKREEGEKIKLSFTKIQSSSSTDHHTPPKGTDTTPNKPIGSLEPKNDNIPKAPPKTSSGLIAVPHKVSVNMGSSSKPLNVFAAAKKNVLGGKKTGVIEQPKIMSEAERIMREEMGQKNKRRLGSGGPQHKKQRL